MTRPLLQDPAPGNSGEIAERDPENAIWLLGQAD